MTRRLEGESAWQWERRLREAARPDPDWIESDFPDSLPSGDDFISLMWGSRVPSSGAPEIPYLSAIQAMGNRGFEVSGATAIAAGAHAAHEDGDIDLRRVLTASMLHALFEAEVETDHPYHRFHHPISESEVMAAIDPPAAVKVGRPEGSIHTGWVGMVVGGAFGTPLEGYTGRTLREHYGTPSGFVRTPDTVNDDLTYSIVLLDALEAGRDDPAGMATEWIRSIPYGWSAEQVALENLRAGFRPPLSATHRNPYTDWIGAQMRTMICGLLHPGNPRSAVHLAYRESSISHSANGAYGGMFAAALTSLAFVIDDPGRLVAAALRCVPPGSGYAEVVERSIRAATDTTDTHEALDALDHQHRHLNWIHAHPNIANVVVALIHGAGNPTDTFGILSDAGLDVDCNAGLAGAILGVWDVLIPEWTTPIGDRLTTYLPHHRELSIAELAGRTQRLAVS